MTKFYKMAGKVEELGRTMTQKEIGAALGVSERTIRTWIRRLGIPYLHKRPEPSRTFQLFLERIGTNTETEIARVAGVSRQRIHQLERKLGVCHLMKEGKRKARDTKAMNGE